MQPILGHAQFRKNLGRATTAQRRGERGSIGLPSEGRLPLCPKLLRCLGPERDCLCRWQSDYMWLLPPSSAPSNAWRILPKPPTSYSSLRRGVAERQDRCRFVGPAAFTCQGVV